MGLVEFRCADMYVCVYVPVYRFHCRAVVSSNEQNLLWNLKARTHRPIFRGLAAESVVESANSIPESVDYTTDSVIVG